MSRHWRNNPFMLLQISFAVIWMLRTPIKMSVKPGSHGTTWFTKNIIQHFFVEKKKINLVILSHIFRYSLIEGIWEEEISPKKHVPRYDIKSYRVRAALHSQSWHYCCLIARHIKYVTWSQNSCCRHSLLPTRHIFCSSLSDVLLVYYSDNMNAISQDDYTTNVTKCRLHQNKAALTPAVYYLSNIKKIVPPLKLWKQQTKWIYSVQWSSSHKMNKDLCMYITSLPSQ